MSTYSYPLFCPSPTAPRLAKRHTPSIYNAKCCVTNPQQPLFSWLKRSFQLEGFKAFGKLFIIVACHCRYRRETEQVLIRVLIHPYSRGDEVPCTLFTYYRGGREESYNQIKTYWDILHRRILDSMSVISQQLASLPSHRRCWRTNLHPRTGERGESVCLVYTCSRVLLMMDFSAVYILSILVSKAVFRRSGSIFLCWCIALLVKIYFTEKVAIQLQAPSLESTWFCLN